MLKKLFLSLVFLTVAFMISFILRPRALGSDPSTRRENIRAFINTITNANHIELREVYIVGPKRKVSFFCKMLVSHLREDEQKYSNSPQELQRYIDGVKKRIHDLETGPIWVDYVARTTDKTIYFSEDEIECTKNYLSYIQDPKRRLPTSEVAFMQLDKDGMPKMPEIRKPFDCENMNRVVAGFKDEEGRSEVLKGLKKQYESTILSGQQQKTKEALEELEPKLEANPQDQIAIAYKAFLMESLDQQDCFKNLLKSYGK